LVGDKHPSLSVKRIDDTGEKVLYHLPHAGSDEANCLLIFPLSDGSVEASLEYALAYENGTSVKTALQLKKNVLQTVAFGHQVSVSLE